jgi:hypothetical protein
VKAGVLVFAVAVGLYLPTTRHDFVQDDRGIIALNPATHSLGAALRAVDDPYWPAPSEAGLWRPLTIVSLALDWTLAGGHPGWLHLANALWHGLASLLVLAVLARWLPLRAATTAALVFAVHPVHVEAVAGLVGRSELLPATAMLAGVLAARGRHWVAALSLAVGAMLAKESGVVVSVVILLYCWLDREVGRPPLWFIAGVAVATAGYLLAWRAVGGIAVADVAAPFIGATTGERLALALPAIWRAAVLLAWPADLSADYGPQVIPVPTGFTIAAFGGLCVIALGITVAWRYRRRVPPLAWAACAAALAYLPTANLLLPSGVVLAERNLYVAVLLPAVVVGLAVERVRALAGRHAALVLTLLVVGPLVARSALRLPAWRSNRAFLITLLSEHPESARGHFWAAGVLGRMGDTAAARASYDRAIDLYDRDPHVLGAAALFHLDVGDTTAAGVLARRARSILPREPRSLRVAYQLARAAGDTGLAAALADTIDTWFPSGGGP